MTFALSAALAAPLSTPVLREEAPPWTAPRVPTVDLVETAREALRAGDAMGEWGRTTVPGWQPGLADVALRWIVAVGEADRAAGVDRLADPGFLRSCLTAWRWVPDVPREGERIRLTRYLVYGVAGETAPTGLFQHALWALPHDEAGLDAASAEARRATLDRFRYTRQDVAAGVYGQGGAAVGHAEPLVWLTHEAHEQALLQGSVAVEVGGKTRLFNVFRNNGIPYDKRERDTTRQRAYWYFRETDAVRGWAREPVTGPALRPYAAVAGDVDHLGFGRLLALHTADGLRLVVLADTGGAFVDNLHQLDLYTGVFASAKAFSSATAAIGDTAEAWVLGVRETPGCAP